MASAVAFGSISIIDTTDIGEFSVLPMSDLPLSVIYDQDQTTFTPNWGTSNLSVTPSVYYAGRPVALGSTGLTISWQRQEGTSGYTNLTTGESIINNGVLNVTANKFTANSTMITYIVTATYVEPLTQITLSAQGQITFTMVKNSSAAKTCVITGDSIFKYNSAGAIVGYTDEEHAVITLTGKVEHVSIAAWQYQLANGNWATYPNSGTGTTLNVTASDATFNNDKCIIRLMTSENTVYDIHTITKLRDGAAGSETVSAVLTNDDQMIPFDSEGHGDFSSATSRIIIYEGGVDVTSTWTITQNASGCTSTPSTTTVQNDTVTVSAFNSGVNTANVTFTCEKEDYNTITKTFSLVKVESGEDGITPTIYSLEADSLALNKDINNTYTPASVTFTSYQQTGNSDKTTYNCRFQIFENITLAEYDALSTKPTPDETSTRDEPSHTYTPSTSATSVLCIQYKAGATTDRLDTQLCVITSDGATGQQGPQGDEGASAVNVILGNYADVLTCNNGNQLMSQQIIKIPFAAYEGTTRIPCTFTSATLLGRNPNAIGTSDTSSKYATANADGQIVWTLPAGTSVPTANGVVSLTFTASATGGDVTVVETYSWSRNTAAANAVLLQIFTPNGTNTITDTISSVTMVGQLMDGSSDVSDANNVSYQWYKWSNGTYSPETGKTTKSLTVNDDDVQSYASYMLEAEYPSSSNKKYKAYFSVFDKHDPIQVTVLSSIGTQIINGDGYGAIYAKVSRNGEEIDRMYSERFSTSDPSSATLNDYYYKINRNNKSVTLMKYNGSSWVASSDSYIGNYRWTWRDKDGNSITSVNNLSLPSQGKVIYIDGDYIDTKIIADVSVEI